MQTMRDEPASQRNIFLRYMQQQSMDNVHSLYEALRRQIEYGATQSHLIAHKLIAKIPFGPNTNQLVDIVKKTYTSI